MCLPLWLRGRRSGPSQGAPEDSKAALTARPSELFEFSEPGLHELETRQQEVEAEDPAA